MKCTSCHKLIANDSNFCEHCGAKLDKAIELSDLTQKLIDHLNFLGYEIENVSTEEKGVESFLARHSNKSNLMVRNLGPAGITFVSIYRMNVEKVKKSRNKFLEIVNKMNNTTILCSYALGESNELVIGSWIPPHYEKKQFTDFLDLYERDINNRFKTEGLMDYAGE